MEKETLKCPNCGANLDLDKKQGSFVCEYCGHKIQNEQSQEAAKSQMQKEFAEKAFSMFNGSQEKINSTKKIGIIIGLVFFLLFVVPSIVVPLVLFLR